MRNHHTKKTTMFALMAFVTLSNQSLASCNLPVVSGIIYNFDAKESHTDVYVPTIELKFKNFPSAIRQVNTENNETSLKSNLEDLLSLNANALAVQLSNAYNGQSVVDIVKNKDVPLVLFNKEPLKANDGVFSFDSELMNSYDKLLYFGNKVEDIAKAQAKMYFNYLNEHATNWDRNNDGLIEVYILRGADALYENTITENISKYLGEMLDNEQHNISGKNGKKITSNEIVETIYDCFDETSTYNTDIARDYWINSMYPSESNTSETKDKRADVIFSNNDALSIQIVEDETFQQVSNLPLYGIGATSYGIKKINSNGNQRIDGSVLIDVESNANIIADLLYKLSKVNEEYTVTTVANEICTDYSAILGEDNVYFDETNKAIYSMPVGLTKKNIDDYYYL